MNTPQLLAKLEERNGKDSESDEYSAHEVLPSTGLGNDTISTLEKGMYRKLSPMLKERYNYAGKWIDATAGITWLSLEEINNFHDNVLLQRQVDTRINNWKDTIFDKFNRGQISLFGVWADEYHEIYLVWVDDSVEPVVYEFRSYYEKIFENLDSYIEYWLDTD